MLRNFFNNPRFSEFSAALKVQSRVVFAIYIKELKARFGQYNLGLLWALLEPMAHVTVFSLIFYMRSKGSQEMDYPIFVMLGILPWILFKNIVRRSVTAITANRAFFNYPNVRPLDAILGRAFLEVNVFIYVTAALCLIFYLAGFDIFFDNFVMFLYASLLIIIMALGFGILFAVLDSYYNSAQKFLNMAFRPLYFLSGIFYPVTIIPEPYLTWFLYNPILQGILLVRNGYNPDYDAEFANPEYLTVFALVVFAAGIFYYSLHWKNVVEKQ